MSTHTIAELQANPRELIDRAREGESVTIVSDGEEVARIEGLPKNARKLVPTDVDWLIANIVARKDPKDDSVTLLRKIRDEEPE